MATLTAIALKLLLDKLDPQDASQAAEKYQELRLKLIKFFAWRGCADSEADSLADESLDRVALKLEKGVEILSLPAYACQVSRFILLEYQRRHRETALNETAVEASVLPHALEKSDERLDCLRRCLYRIIPDAQERTLLLSYYDSENGEKNKVRRKSLAEKLGVTMNTLKVRVCRLRDKVEICTKGCLTQIEV